MRKAQQGTSYLAILFGVVIFAIAVKAVLAVWPAYWDDRVINNQITELMQQSSADITPQKFMTFVICILKRLLKCLTSQV